MIRQVANGVVSAEPNACYCVQSRSTKRGQRIYIVKDGAAKLCWDRPGSKSNPYQIWTRDDLKKVKKDPAGYYLLMKDIAIPTGNTECLPVLWEAPFTGVFDGQGHKIYSQNYQTGTTVDMTGKTVKDTDPGSTYGRTLSCGLFGVNMGIITRLDLRDLHLFFPQTTARYGMVVGSNRGIIDQIKSRSAYRISNEKTPQSGGITAMNTGTVQYCINDGNGGFDYNYFLGCAGGITYYNWGQMENCAVSQNTPASGATGNYGCLTYYHFPGSKIKDCCYTAANAQAKAVFDDGGTGGGEQINVKKVINQTFFPRVDFATIIY